MQFGWRRSIRTLLGLALLVAWAPLGYAQSLPARLLAVSSASDPSTFVVLLETSEEVRYRTRQPDALSLVVELRNVTGRSADNRFIPSSTGPVRAVTIEERRESDDSFTTLVRLAIDRPLPYRVAPAGSSLRIEFARMVDEDDMAGTDGDVTVPTGTLEAFPAADIATEITDIDTQRVAGGVTVTLRGNGRLLAGYIGPVAGSPPRLMLDFPNVTASVPSLLAPAAGPIDQIRVALNSRSPLVTRVVLDLAAEVDYETLPSESNGRDLRLLVRDVERAAPVNLALAPTSGRDPTTRTIAIGDPRRIDPLSALAEPSGGIDAARERAPVDDPGALLIRPEVPPASGPLTVAPPSGTTDTPATPPPAMSSAAFAGPEPSPLAAEPLERPERVVEPTSVDVAAVPMERAAPVDAPARPVSPVARVDSPVARVESPVARVESPVASVESPVASVESPVARIDPGAALASAPVAAPIVSDAFEPLGAEPVAPVSTGSSPVSAEPSPVPIEAVSQPVPSQVPTAAPLILGDASVGEPVPSDTGLPAPPAVPWHC